MHVHSTELAYGDNLNYCIVPTIKNIMFKNLTKNVTATIKIKIQLWYLLVSFSCQQDQDM